MAFGFVKPSVSASTKSTEKKSYNASTVAQAVTGGTICLLGEKLVFISDKTKKETVLQKGLDKFNQKDLLTNFLIKSSRVYYFYKNNLYSVKFNGKNKKIVAKKS